MWTIKKLQIAIYITSSTQQALKARQSGPRSVRPRVGPSPPIGIMGFLQLCIEGAFQLTEQKIHIPVVMVTGMLC